MKPSVPSEKKFRMPETAPKTRNKDATRAALIMAARQVLAEQGFQGFGVNAIARQAGCDKQLIYRYFGGIEGLLVAIGEDLANWISDAVSGGPKPATYGELMQSLGLSYLRALKANPLMQKIVAWEMAGPSEHLKPLTAARSRGMMRWMAGLKGDLQPPAGADAAVLNALLIGAIQQLVLASASAGQFSGLPLQTDEDWRRVEAGLAGLITRLYPD
jgi:AcrR family transcriptional regulator